MSGHSKWASIKHQKGVTDARRGQLFTKLTRELIIAAREGGGSPDMNFRLRLAIQKGTGEIEGGSLVELTLEGYGPGGTAIMVNALSDNRNRTVQEVRNIFTRNGTNLGESGCVSWIFDSKGIITIKAGDADPDELALNAIDAGAEDVKVEDDYVEVYTTPDKFETVRKTLEAQGVNIETSEISMVPKTTVELDEKTANQALKFMEKLEENDDVQNVYSNADFPDSVLEGYES
jgi:YebC/PmpR family DNA-binding regulatory protein